MKNILLSLLFLGFFIQALQAFDPAEEIKRLGQQLSKLTEQQIQINSSSSYSIFKKDLNILRKHYNLLDATMQQQSDYEQYTVSMDLLGSAIFLLESNLQQYEEFAPQKVKKIDHHTAYLQFSVYRTLYDSQLEKIDCEIVKTRTSKNIKPRLQKEAIAALMQERKVLLEASKVLSTTYETSIRIGFEFHKLQSNDTEAKWVVQDATANFSGSKDPGSLGLKLQASNKNNLSSEAIIHVQRQQNNALNITDCSLRLPMNYQLHGSTGQHFELQLHNCQALPILDYQHKGKRYVYWTDTADNIDEFVKRVRKALQ